MTNLNEELPVEESQEEEVLSSQPETTEENEAENTEEETTQENTVTLSKSEYTKLKRRAIAYQSLKENSPAPKEKKSSPDINPDELYLIAKGYGDDALEQLRIIARGSGTTLKEALNNPLFKTYETTQKNEERKAKAKLGASNGSGFSQGGPAVKPNMTQEEHMAVWNKMSGK